VSFDGLNREAEKQTDFPAALTFDRQLNGFQLVRTLWVVQLRRSIRKCAFPHELVLNYFPGIRSREGLASGESLPGKEKINFE